ncbi:MAG: PAS domain S-box protein [Sideroxyarcus sp.]
MAMNNFSAVEKTSTHAGDLRRRAEDRLKKELAVKNLSQQLDVGRRLYDQRINQIEIELLTDEFNRLRQKISSQSNSQQAQDSSGRSYFFLNREGRICDAKFHGTIPAVVNKRKWIGRSLNDCILHGTPEMFQACLEKVFESDGKITCELSFDQTISKNILGMKLPLHASIEAVADDEKLLCLVVIEDISTRKIAEEREKASNAALAMLNRTIEASRNEIFMFDAETLCFTFANQRALENLGYTMEELKWLTPADIQAHVFNQEMDSHISFLLSHKQNIRKFNAVHLRRNCSMYPVEIYLQLFEREVGSYFIAIALDTSSQTAAESKLKSIIESADAIIWATDMDSNLEFLSDQMQDILGYSASQFIGSSLVNMIEAGYFHQSDKEKLIEGFKQVAKGGNRVSDVRCRAKQADGTWRWLSVNMAPNRSVDGEVSQIVGVMHDVHAQKLAEEALLQLNQELDSRVREEIQRNMEKDLLLQRQSRLAAMGEMIGNIAHQWRQPINSLGLILGDLEDAALYGECDLSYIQTAVGKSKIIIKKMSSTIDDFRHFFRADKSQGAFSLKHVTDECLNLVEAAMMNHNIDIIVNCEQDVVVMGYANEYSQAIMNILSNAREAIIDRKNTEGRIVIEISENGEFGVHTITDNGGGIPDEVLPKIFEPHFTTKEQGVGIGLYMTLISIERNMHGKINVENVAGGARFSICLPKS